MAARSAPVTAAVLDNSAATADPTIENSKKVKALSTIQYRNVIRFIQTVRMERMQVLWGAAVKKLIALNTAADSTKAISGLQEGSDQVDVQSIVVWLNGITSSNTTSITQLIAIEATCNKRARA